MNSKMNTKKTLLASMVGLFAAAGGASSAMAQGDEAATAQGRIDEIIVTAQKRGEQTLVETPISIAVLQGSDLDNAGARSISDVLNGVGGVNLVETQPGQNVISIRGSAAPFFASTTVGYYLDELPFSFVNFNFVPDVGAFDVERVEVLRGPQGTLFGASALSGVVRVLTHDADLEKFEFKTRARFESTEDGDGSYSGDVAANMPLIPGKLAIRAVASYSDLGGFIDAPSSEDVNDSEIGAYRIKVNAQPTDELAIEFGASASRIENSAPSRGADDYTTIFDLDQPDIRDYDVLTLEMEYDFPSFSVLSATSQMDYTTNSEIAASFGAPVIVGQQLDAEIFSQEVRAASAIDGPWQWSAGVFYRTLDQLIVQSLSAFFADNFHVVDESKSYAVFGEITRSLLDNKLDITIGARYFEDTVDTLKVSNFTGPENLGLENDFDDLSGRIVLTYYPSDDLTVYGSVARGFRSGFNQPPSILVPNAEPVEPDALLSYEFGVKGFLLNHRLTYETAIYYTDWQDAAQTVDAGGGFAQTVNSESVSGIGLDANISMQPTDGLTLGLNVGWNDLTFDDDVISAGSVLFNEGDRTNLSAEYTAGFSVEYIFPLENAMQARIATSGNYYSELLQQDTGFASDEIFNARLSFGIESQDNQWGLSLFVENFTNEDGKVDPYEAVFDGTVRLRPRTYGAQLIYNY